MEGGRGERTLMADLEALIVLENMIKTITKQYTSPKGKDSLLQQV
jgi:hypothetical protein